MKRTYHATKAFLDMLLLLNMGFIILFSLAFIMMKQEDHKNKNIETKAEFVITVTWPKDLGDDVDVWVEDPGGKLVYFQRREDGLMHLDRDDLGHRNDTFKLPDGTIVKYDENREVVTLRGILEGEYVVNVHMYYKSNGDECPVSVRIEKMNPFSTVLVKEVILTKKGQEETVCRFTLDSSGNVTEINELEKQLTTRRGGFNEYQHYEDE